MNLDDPIEVALLAARSLEAAGLACALYGGLLTAVYGEPRETRDADFVVLRVSAEQVRSALDAQGIDAALAFDGVVFGGLRVGRVTVLAASGDSGLNTIDLVQSRDEAYARRVLDRAVHSTLRGQPIRVVAAEDYVVLKVLSTRERDLEDAAAVLARNRDLLDLDLVASELDSLARSLPDAEIARRRNRLEQRAGTLVR